MQHRSEGDLWPENVPYTISIGDGKKTEKWGNGDGKKNPNRTKTIKTITILLKDETKGTNKQARSLKLGHIGVDCEGCNKWE